MKKLAVFAMSCMLACAGTSAVFAEGEVAESFDYSMMDEDLYEGSWINAFDVFDFYLPNDWVITCNGEEGEDPDEDVRFNVTNEEETRCMKITYEEDEMPDFDAFIEELTEEGADLAELVDINGITGVAYVVSDDENEVVCNGILIPTEDGGMYTIMIVSLQDDEDFKGIGLNIISSMGIHEE